MLAASDAELVARRPFKVGEEVTRTDMMSDSLGEIEDEERLDELPSRRKKAAGRKTDRLLSKTSELSQR